MGVKPRGFGIAEPTPGRLRVALRREVGLRPGMTDMAMINGIFGKCLGNFGFLEILGSILEILGNFGIHFGSIAMSMGFFFWINSYKLL